MHTHKHAFKIKTGPGAQKESHSWVRVSNVKAVGA